MDPTGMYWAPLTNLPGEPVRLVMRQILLLILVVYQQDMSGSLPKATGEASSTSMV